MEISNEEFRNFGMRTTRPTPGQSLTGNPETPQSWETPPEFTTKEEAIEHFFSMFTEEERHAAIMSSLEEGVPIMDLVQMFLTKSFQEGEINPDLMLLLAEPLAFLLMGLAERQGIKPKIIEDDGEDPLVETKDESLQNIFKSNLQKITAPQDDDESRVQKKLEGLPSIMDKEE